MAGSATPCTRFARRASVHAARPAPPVRLAQLELLQLAGRGTDQLIPQLDRGRALVVRHPAPAVFDEIALDGGGTRTQHDPGLHGRAPLFVRDAGPRDLRDRAMLDE